MTEPTHTHPSPTKALGQKVHGIPAWAIGAGLAVLFVLAYVIYKRRANAAVNTTPDASPQADQPGDAIDPSTGLPWSAEPGGYGNAIDPSTGLPFQDSPSYPVGMSPQGTPTPHTNAQWARYVLDELIALGDDPTLISNAITKYLSGAALSAAEQGVINVALQKFGAPPEGVLPINGSPAPTGGGTGDSHPGTPSAPKVLSNAGGKVSVTVPAVAGATSYEWQIDGANHDHTLIPIYVYGLTRGKTYRLSVSAGNKSGSGSVSPATTVAVK